MSRLERFLSIREDDIYISYYEDEEPVYRHLDWEHDEAQSYDEYAEMNDCSFTLEDELDKDNNIGYTIVTDPDEIDKILMMYELTK